MQNLPSKKDPRFPDDVLSGYQVKWQEKNELSNVQQTTLFDLTCGFAMKLPEKSSKVFEGELASWVQWLG